MIPIDFGCVARVRVGRWGIPFEQLMGPLRWYGFRPYSSVFLIDSSGDVAEIDLGGLDVGSLARRISHEDRERIELEIRALHRSRERQAVVAACGTVYT
jgi:hypothetical protein